MLDLFTIFTKGGIVLWCFQQGSTLSLTPAVNALIKSVILQERPGSLYNHGNLTMCFKMDNQYELIFVAAYQNIVTLSYVDKLIDQVCLAFRDKYKNDLVSGLLRMVNFSEDFHKIHRAIEEEASIQAQQPKKMKTFSESRKSEKNSSLVVSVKGQVGGVAPLKEEATEVRSDDTKGTVKASPRNNILKKLGTRDRGSRTEKKASGKKSGPVVPAKRSKEARVWEGGSLGNKDHKSLNYSADNGNENGNGTISNGVNGTGLGVDYSGEDDGGAMKELQPLQVSPASSASQAPTSSATSASSSGGGLMSFFKSLTTGKKVTREAMAPVLEKLKEHLIKKNVAVEIADKLCESVAVKLDGKVISNFTGMQSTVRSSMEESLVQILSPKVRIDVLHDVKKSSERGVPYVITFCGVNGVGKSTNLAKVAFWLMRNDYRVLIAACDTFRSGAVEQLRTHAQHLSSLIPPKEENAPPNVMLYDRGYKKDPAGVAMEAVHFATQQKYDVVLVDTAGRMQDNEPLMRALAKLIRVNSPDLVLFVGEALVGNEAVDQLVKFNRALVDHSEEGNTRTIDGIVLTKFDTIDDKVGAAISMTYTTGQPIVFIGTGQRYTDIKSLNVQAVVAALLK